MPPPRKINLIPAELRHWLAEELQLRGFADIVAVTDALNARLDDEGVSVTIGKSAVGEFSRLLKDQRDAFSMAETLLQGMDVEAESDLHKMLLHMIATSAAMMMKQVRDDGEHLDAKELMALGRMLKDLMASAGIREKLRDDERQRVAKAAQEEQRLEMEGRLETAASQGRISHDAMQAARMAMGLAE